MRNALAHVPKGQRLMVAALIRTAFAETDAERAPAQGRAANPFSIYSPGNANVPKNASSAARSSSSR